MASILIRRLDDTVKERLRVRAAAKGQSMEMEARAILTQALEPRAGHRLNLFESIRAHVEPVGGFDLEPEPRTPLPPPVEFEA